MWDSLRQSFTEVFLRLLWFYHVSVIPPTLYTRPHLSTTVMKKAGGKAWEPAKKIPFYTSGNTGGKNTFSLCFVESSNA
jgi:hypothetical protein